MAQATQDWMGVKEKMDSEVRRVALVIWDSQVNHEGTDFSFFMTANNKFYLMQTNEKLCSIIGGIFAYHRVVMWIS